MSFVPALAEAAAAALAKEATVGEITAGTGMLEGARYGVESFLRQAKKYKKAHTWKGTIKTNRRKYQRPNTYYVDIDKTKMKMDEGEASRLGEAPGTGVSKRTSSGYGPDPNTSTNQLYIQEIFFPNKGTDINDRPNDMIYLKGLKYCANFAPSATGVSESFFVNFAIVSRKDNVSQNTSFEENMFRSRQDTRSQDFEATGQAIDRHCLALNTDKFHVWVHKRFKLRGLGTNMTGSKMMSGYIPIKRQIRFDGSNRPNGELHAIWWCGEENTVSVAPFSSVQPTNFTNKLSPAINTNMSFTTYWDDPVSVTMLQAAMKSLRRTKYKRKSRSKGPYRGYQ